MLEEKSLNIDLIRVSACFLVVVLHSVVVGMNDTSYEYWDALNVIESFTRMSVPLFIMITGCLLIRKKTSFIQSISRAKRLIITLLLWSLIYYSYRSYTEGISFRTIDFFNLFVRNQIFYHLWYLYAAIGFLFIIPMLSSFYYSTPKRDVVIFVSIWLSLLFFSLLNIHYNLGVNLNWILQSQLFSSLSVYLLIGRILIDSNPIKNKVVPYAIVMIIITCTLSTAYITKLISPYGGAVNQLFYDNSSIFVGIPAISFMYFILNIEIKNKIIVNIIRITSPCTLGIYLIHPIIIDSFRLYFLNYYNIVPEVDIVIPMSFFAFFVSLFSILLLRKIGLSRLM